VGGSCVAQGENWSSSAFAISRIDKLPLAVRGMFAWLMGSGLCTCRRLRGLDGDRAEGGDFVGGAG